MKTLMTFLAFFTAVLAAQGARTVADTVAPISTLEYRRIVGLNMSPLLAQLVPFNRTNPREAGPFLVRFKKYGPLGRSAFRFSMGFHLIPDDELESGENLQFNFAMGWEKRRSLSNRWSYYRGFDFMFLAGDLQVPGDQSQEFGAAFAVGPLWGLEFALDNRITIGTEAVLAVGFGTDVGFILTIIPPVGVFLHHYF